MALTGWRALRPAPRGRQTEPVISRSPLLTIASKAFHVIAKKSVSWGGLAAAYPHFLGTKKPGRGRAVTPRFPRVVLSTVLVSHARETREPAQMFARFLGTSDDPCWFAPRWPSAKIEKAHDGLQGGRRLRPSPQRVGLTSVGPNPFGIQGSGPAEVRPTCGIDYL